jgi:hypothetical protein
MGSVGIKLQCRHISGNCHTRHEWNDDAFGRSFSALMAVSRLYRLFGSSCRNPDAAVSVSEMNMFTHSSNPAGYRERRRTLRQPFLPGLLARFPQGFKLPAR